jgi:phosphohistidine phosphatase
MQLYLMQHGMALSAQEDAERPLSPAGVDQVRASAAGIRQLKLAFDLIISSPKRRAHQTAALVAESLRYAYSDISRSESLLPRAEPGEVLKSLAGEPAGSRVLLVGHQPLLGRLARHLLGGEVALENAGLCGFEYDAEKPACRLTLLLNAGQLARFGAVRSVGS